ncbi:MAG: B12-binding domain-containing radical SAM protein [Eubacterium sp.]|jgi:Fe-S oxidoreductase|nr:B12-binding domain-containing radical SAM protein [Eubacterium sp.]
MRYEGTVYRPPSEARSLIVQATVGCAHNRCTFCTMYKDKKFYVRDTADILADFEEAARMYVGRISRIFLADGDALGVDTSKLLEILSFIKEKFPNVERVSAYGTPKDVLKKEESELTALKDAGLKMIYMGAESGDDEVLRQVAKGVTAAEIAKAGQKLKRCGLLVSVTFISGLGGKARLAEHARESARLVSQMNPDYVGFLTLMLEEGAPILKRIRSGELELLRPEDILEEMTLFLQETDSPGTVFRSNHASNYIMLKGTLNQDREAMLQQLEHLRESRRFRPENARML